MAGAEQDQEVVLEKFNEYLSQLRQSDPQEYDALMQEMMAAKEAQDAPQPEMSEEEAQKLLEQMNAAASAEGVVRTPGGDVMGESGLKAHDEGEDVQPEPGFVVKAVRVDEGFEGAKVFVNVCVSDKLGEPAKKVKLDDNGEEQEGLNIPLSMGPPHADTDKAGNDCLVFDVIVNPKVIEECVADNTGDYQSFVCQLALNYVKQKHEVTVSDRFRLPRMQYKGPTPCRKQRIRTRKAPTIQEVPNSRPKAKPAAKRPAKPARPTENIAYQLCDGNGDPVPDDAEPGDESPRPSEYVFTGSLPLLSDPVSLEVELSAQLLVVRAEGYRALELLLAHPVDEDEVTTRFYRDTRKLEVRAPTCDLEYDGPDPGSNAWLLAQALAVEDPSPSSSSSSSSPSANPSSPSKTLLDVTGSDPFHLKAPKAPAPIRSTMADAPVEEDEELPEDRFHRNDLMSQHIIEQKKQQIQEKRDQAKKDREDMDNDPNIQVERIGYDDDGEETKETLTLPSSKSSRVQVLDEEAEEEEDAVDATEATQQFAASMGSTSSLAFELL